MEIITRAYPNEWWVSRSCTGERAGGGSSGITHELTEERQGAFHYTIGPYSDPVLHIRPGDRVIVETSDASKARSRARATYPPTFSKCRG